MVESPTVAGDPKDGQSEQRRPAIVAVDDEPAVLAAVSRDLQARLRRALPRDARGLRSPTVSSCSKQVRARGDQVALLIADQRMPGLSGTDYLVQARELAPDAKRVLLTAYADTEAAIQAINEVALDYYLLKPWDPPEEELFPVLEDLLTTWEAGAALESGGVRVIGHRFSKQTHDVRDFLARNRVPARWLDVERDGEARELLTVAGVDAERLPVALLEDGSILERPTMLELAERLGISAQPIGDHYDLVIVGGGPAGLAAAVYGASEGLRTVMVEREAPGGQAGQSSRIENYLGFPTGLSGSDLARRATDQARRLGAELLTVQEAMALEVEGAGRLLRLTGGGVLSANTVLVASGVSYRKLSAPGFAELTGAGIYYGAALTEARACAGPARRRDRRRQLRRTGRRVLQRLCVKGDDAGSRRFADEVDVAISDRADRGAPERRGAHGRAGGRRRGQGWPPSHVDGSAPRTGPRRSSRSTPASCSSAPHRAPTGSTASSRVTSAGSSSPGRMCATTAGR